MQAEKYLGTNIGEHTSQKIRAVLFRHGRRAGEETINGKTIAGKIINGTTIRGKKQLPKLRKSFLMMRR